MTWRRIAPWVIGLIAVVALFVALPRSVPAFSWLPDEVLGVEFRTVLGLDLAGGLRVTLLYVVKGKWGEAPNNPQPTSAISLRAGRP